MEEKKVEELLEQIQVQLSHLNNRVDFLEKSVSKLFGSASDQGEQQLQMHGRLFKTEFDLIDTRGAIELLKVDIQQINRRLSQAAEAAEPK